MRIRNLFVAAFMSFAASASAQQSEEFKSTIFNADGTVTFKFKNDKATDVQVDVQFAGRKPMTKSADGVWTATVGPAAPDMYPYCFVVDGVSVMDPQCQQWFPNEGFKNSLLDIPAPSGALIHDIKNVPHGKVSYVNYYSKSLGAYNNALVYTPPTYDFPKNAEKKYPVFYLISGTTDTEEVYYKVGRMNYILDNLLAEGAAKEMIIVLPYGNPYKLLPSMPQGGMPATQFGGDVFSNDLVNDLMPYVESHYRTINDRDHRAIGGFSRGGNQGLSNGLHNLDKFSYLCSYSSFTSTDIPGVYDNAADTNSKIHLFWLGVGTDDFLYGNARDYMEFLDQKGIRSVKEYTNDKFGHTWMNARFFLDHTLRLLFNPEASEEAMKNGKPALAKTGQEQQFTAGVMARLFPRPIVSPEYGDGKVTFRFKAENAKQVMLDGELVKEPQAMKKDADGVWEITLTGVAPDTYRYCYIVDGMQVADPNSLWISPDNGFKYSIAEFPDAPYNIQHMGQIPHGEVSVATTVNGNIVSYVSPGVDFSQPAVCALYSGAADTYESWFRTGHANLIADRLVAEGKIKPVIFIMSQMPNHPQFDASRMPFPTIKSTDYADWPARRKALEALLLEKFAK